MAGVKLPQLVNPLTGNKSSLSVSTILGMILASVIGLFAFAQAQNINKKISGKLGIDTEIDSIVAERPKVVESFKRYV